MERPARAGQLAALLAVAVAACGGEAPPVPVVQAYVLPGAPDDPWDFIQDGLSFKLRRADHCAGFEIPGTAELTHESVEVLVAPTQAGQGQATVGVALGDVILPAASPDGTVWRFVAYRAEEIAEGSELRYGRVEGTPTLEALSTSTGLRYWRERALRYLR